MIGRIAAGALLGAVSAWGVAPGAAGQSTPRTVYAPGVCRVTDGDTLRCGAERVRMVEIDAPEMPGHCRRGRVCAPGDPRASKANLVRLTAGRRVTVVRYTQDRYGRTVGDARVGGKSLSCLQIRGGYAVRELKWDDFGVTRRECP